MKTGTAKKVRCAIYTRVSTDQGLEQDFNSLDAQYDASQAYIRSQAHAGWALIRSKYDDGGFSGGNTDRPALQRLLDDVRARRIDVIVVYKVDRLTRSLADFAKLVELFDQHGVSFVSVTQQFNTTTSMGRLTLNVLLSFAQFEREVTSERIRDKVAASKRKGLWVGGKTPLGYEVKDHKVVVVEKDANAVRTIFKLYLELGSIHRLLPTLRKRGIVTKEQALRSGRTIGGIPFARGSLSYLLHNRFYIGEVAYKGEILPGGQTPIIGRDLFDAVQTKLAEQRNNHVQTRSRTEALLTGLIFDDAGNRMSPSHARKNGVRYRYYTSSALLQGRPEQAGSVDRVPATEIEGVVADAIGKHLKLPSELGPTDLIKPHVARVEVRPQHLIIALREQDPSEADDGNSTGLQRLEVAWSKPPSKRRREILLPASPSTAASIRPIRADARARLVVAIAQGRRWLSELTTSADTSTEQIAARERCSIRKVNMTISLAFLAPDLVKAAIEGRLPRGIGMTRLSDLPAEWALQRQALGLAAQG
jgi:DNA invertase Pin-like site-specific DNA recombinase